MRDDKWHNRFMSIAMQVAQWSKDPSSQVGSCITKNNRIIGTGYNGWPAGLDDSIYLEQWDIDKESARALKNKHMIHAEDNAMSHSVIDTNGATLYITHPPCITCAHKIVNNGIACVVLLDNEDKRFEGAWNCEESFKVLSDNLIPVIKLKGNKND